MLVRRNRAAVPLFCISQRTVFRFHDALNTVFADNRKWKTPVMVDRGYFRGAAVAGDGKVYLFGGIQDSLVSRKSKRQQKFRFQSVCLWSVGVSLSNESAPVSD
jgi:hypothetical protein